jgi:hypothetical protein
LEVKRIINKKCSPSGEYGAIFPKVALAFLLLITLVFLQACNQPLWNNSKQNDILSKEITDGNSSAPFPSPTFSATPLRTQEITAVPTFNPLITPISKLVVFAVIGDYGGAAVETGEVARMMINWQPDFIITVGDNNYPKGAADHIDAAIGQYFHNYIYPYKGIYGKGADINRFFPSLGNHDVKTDDGQPYFDYFILPGNERYYDFVWGPVHLFALNTLSSEPDGYRANSKQAAWLQERLASSTSTWKIVYGHHSPYSSGEHGSIRHARWPFAQWGVDAVLSAHDHTYERLLVAGITYIVNGLGGYSIYDFDQILKESQACYNDDYGALRVEATEDYLLFQFYNRKVELIDQLKMVK